MEEISQKCVNCGRGFLVDSDDKHFYEELSIPPPTFCPECRIIRRQLFRNERVLYRRTCALCGKGMLSMYAPEKPYVVYCLSCYHSDNWDPLAYGRNYDFSKNFFEQFRAFMAVVPRGAFYLDFAEGTEFANWAVYLKNSYLIFGGHHYEDCINASSSLYLANCVDVDFSKKCESCYDGLHLRQCNRVNFSTYSEDCADSSFLCGCRNCHHCIGCTNLRNKSYCILNVQYSKEEFEKKRAELKLDTYEGIRAFAQEFAKHSINFPRKFAWNRNTTNAAGDDLEQVKNIRYAFSVTESENIRYSFFVPTGAKDVYDADHVGLGTELTAELMSGFGNNRVAFGNRIYYSHDVQYSDDCHNSAYLFGCIGLRKKEYCILNKQYTKEEYEKLISQIIAQMNEMPYVDRARRAHKYGEFFPGEIAPFAYNETVAQEYFPISKELASKHGYIWRESEKKSYEITRPESGMPSASKDAPDSILEDVIECAHKANCGEQCTAAFRIIPQELAFYRRFEILLPRLCPNCRHYGRLKKRNPLKLWQGKCRCAGVQSENGVYANTAPHFHGHDHCPNEFEAPYAPDRPEIVYCEACYQSEVV